MQQYESARNAAKSDEERAEIQVAVECLEELNKAISSHFQDYRIVYITIPCDFSMSRKTVFSEFGTSSFEIWKEDTMCGQKGFQRNKNSTYELNELKEGCYYYI